MTTIENTPFAAIDQITGALTGKWVMPEEPSLFYYNRVEISYYMTLMSTLQNITSREAAEILSNSDAVHFRVR